MEPKKFWKEVPNSLKPIYHFFNVPIGAEASEDNSPLRFFQETVKEKDFVSFKLDIDTPDIEIPLALKLAQKGQFSKLVDEFFFELHFRCECLMFYGWGSAMPDVSHNLTLDRPHALEFFTSLRKLGIRAHFWG